MELWADYEHGLDPDPAFFDPELSEDSNGEGHYTNDYPEDPSYSEDGSGGEHGSSPMSSDLVCVAGYRGLVDPEPST